MFSLEYDRLPHSALSSLQDNTVYYAVGDIHGNIHALKTLQLIIEADRIKQPQQNAKIIYLGDYVDRLTGSKNVINHLINNPIPHFKHQFLLGNHEWAMLRFMEGVKGSDAWLHWGGKETLISYGIDVNKSAPYSSEELKRMQVGLKEALPKNHLLFLEELQIYVTHGDFLFVHAGIDPKKPLIGQSMEDMLMIREDFTDSDTPPSQPVIFGHTVYKTPFIAENRIGIDTGAYYTNRLTALRLSKDGFAFLQS